MATSFDGRVDQKRSLQVLGLSPGASEDDIQQAYRRLALEHHPDKNDNDPEATKKFQEISQAYRTLSKGDSSDDDDCCPFHRHSFYDDDDDDEHFGFFGHPLFAMFAQEMLFQEMIRQMHARRYGGYDTYEQSQQRGRRYGNQRRQGNQSNTRHDARTPSWARGYYTREEHDRQGHNATRTNQFRSTQSDSSRRPFTSERRGRDWEESRRSRQTDDCEGQSGNNREGDSSNHTPEQGSQAKSNRRNRRFRRRKQPQKNVLTQPKKPSKKELLAQEKRRQREVEKIGRELKNMQLNGDEESEKSEDTRNQKMD